MSRELWLPSTPSNPFDLDLHAHTYTVQKSKDPAAEAAKKKAELEKRLEVCVASVWLCVTCWL